MANAANSDSNDRAAQLAAGLGALVRERRKAEKLTQEELSLATGVGRRFIVDLETGKPTCALGKALVVADALGVSFSQGVAAALNEDDALLLPDPDDEA